MAPLANVINFLSTCKQLYTEAATVLHGQLAFTFLSWDIFSRFQGHLEYGREHLRHLKLRCVEHGESLDHHTQYENTVVEGIKLIQKLPCVQVVHFVIEYYLPKEQRPMNLVFRFVRDGSRFAMLFGFTNTGFYLGVDYAVVRPQPTGWSLRCRFEDFANHRAHHRWLKFVDRALTVLGTQQHAFKQLSDQHDRWIWNVES